MTLQDIERAAFAQCLRPMSELSSEARLCKKRQEVREELERFGSVRP